MTDRPALTPATELRESRRYPVSWRAQVQLADGSFRDYQAFDVSKGGVGLLGEHPLVMGAKVRVALRVPVRGTATFQAMVLDALVVFQVLAGNGYRSGLQWADPASAAGVLKAAASVQSSPLGG